MGFLKGFGILIIVLSIAGFVYALYESSVLSSSLVALVAIFSLVGGIYVGYLGIVVEDLQDRQSGTRYIDNRLPYNTNPAENQIAKSKLDLVPAQETLEESARSQKMSVIGRLKFSSQSLTLRSRSPQMIVISYNKKFEAKELDVLGLPSFCSYVWAGNPIKAIQEGREVGLQVSLKSLAGHPSSYTVEVEFDNKEEGKKISGTFNLEVL